MINTADQPNDGPPVRSVLSQTASRRLVATATIVSIIILLSILLVGLVWPQHFQSAIAKFFVCFGLSFCFSIIMFVIYPQNARIKNIPFINLPVELVGPPALFVVSIALLWFLYPGPLGRFYLVQKQGKPAEFQLETFEIKPITGNCAYYPARRQTDQYLVGGIYVEFRDDSKCTAQIGNSFETYQVSFGVLDRTSVIDVKPN
jgi:hypothetical protein